MLGYRLEKQGPYVIGERLGRGSFGTVHSGLNLDTGEVIAIKIFKMSNRHNNTLLYIMQEIELLKELSHQNIVKYLGSSMTSEQLCIYMEFCESGSLKAMIKKFGNFSEKLAAVYMSQVLQGLIYLHGQGIIHRDVKAANILMNKEGQTKIADFGIASRTNEPANPMMGSPYWMAPEIINLNDPVPESDVWSVGCTIIELIDGNPPYWNMPAMSALYHIVQDEVPPIPQSASTLLKSFLLECFRKDHNLRVNANKLIAHRWVNIYKSDSHVSSKVKKENEQHCQVVRYTSYDNPDIPSERDNASPTSADKYVPEASDCSPLSDTDNWEIGLDLDDLQSTGKISLVAGKRSILQKELKSPPANYKQLDHDCASVQKYEDSSCMEDFLEFDDENIVLNKHYTSTLQDSCLSLANEYVVEDAMNTQFWNEDEYVEKNQKSVWIGTAVEKFLLNLRSRDIETLGASINELNVFFSENLSHKKYLITHHCQLPIVEELERNSVDFELISILLKFINEVSVDYEDFRESLCLLGVIPSILYFTRKEYPYNIRNSASLFVRNICVSKNSTVAQMFMSCRGLATLITYFNEEYPKYELAKNATDAIESLLNLQCSTPRNTICSVLVSNGSVPRMINSLSHFTSKPCESIYSNVYSSKVVTIFLTFSMAGADVSELFVKNVNSISELIKIAYTLQPDSLLKLLKCLKNISMNPETLDVLHKAGTIEFLVNTLGKRDLVNYKEVQNQVLNIAFNLCRINRERLHVAIESGLLAHLLPFVDSKSPVRQFALPLLCEAAHVGQYCRQIVHMQGILDAYIRLLKDTNWQISALDSIMCWFETRSERLIIERVLLLHDSMDKLVGILESRHSRDVPSVLSNLKSMVMLSLEISNAISAHKKRVIESLCAKMRDTEAQVRLGALRLMLSLMSGMKFTRSDLPLMELLEETVRFLCQEDVAVLVCEIARKLIIEIKEKISSIINPDLGLPMLESTPK